MRPEILIVEDEPDRLKYYGLWVPEIVKEAAPLRLAPFQPMKAKNLEEARERIEQRRDIYDLIVLDLYLPGRGDGFQLLTEVYAQNAAREVIVVSGHLRPETGMTRDESDARAEDFLKLIQGGVADFIYKDQLKEKKPLQEAVWRSLMRTVTRSSKDRFEQRIKELVPYAEQGLVSHFSRSFSNCIREVSRAEDAIRADLLARWGLDLDRGDNDPLLQHLDRIDDALQEGRTEWGSLSVTFGLCNQGASEQVDIRLLLEELTAHLEPCLTTKKANITLMGAFLAPLVQSFDGDVRAILTEIILGALVDLDDFGKTDCELEFSCEILEDHIEVTMRDRLAQIYAEDAVKINAGVGVRPDGRFGRAWGLSIVQHAALRGAGRLTVEALSSGNAIRYRVPLAANA